MQATLKSHTWTILSSGSKKYMKISQAGSSAFIGGKTNKDLS